MPARTYQVEFTRAADRDIRRLERNVLRRIKQKTQALADDPRPAGVVKLQGGEKTYRVRVGDYRILYEIHDDVSRVLIVKVGHRREVYRPR